ncbi:MAG: hypothetical protein V3U92_10255 [Cellulophaga sp.]
MKIICTYLALFMVLAAQSQTNKKVEKLKERKELIITQEKAALKLEIEDITKRLEKKLITKEEAQILKEAAAKKRALNMENRIAIIENKIALQERNKGDVLVMEEGLSIYEDDNGVTIHISDEPWKFFKRKEPRYDRRTYSDFVVAVGLNNAIIEGQSLEDSPYKVGGSRFFEFGWTWRTRVFKESNFVRFHYGFSFQFNGLKPKDNKYFMVDGGQTQLETFEYDLKKSKFRMDNLVFPVHFEFGPSKYRETDDRVRYSIVKRFRVGLGAYGGFNMGTRQKLKYKRAGENVKEKLKRGYNTPNFVYGLSGYVGVGGVQLYAKYDLSPIFKNAVEEQHNISLGLRFDL